MSFWSKVGTFFKSSGLFIILTAICSLVIYSFLILDTNITINSINSKNPTAPPIPTLDWVSSIVTLNYGLSAIILGAIIALLLTIIFMRRKNSAPGYDTVQHQEVELPPVE